MENFLFSAGAVLPLLLSILTGYVFARMMKWDSSVFKKLNKIVFTILLPVNLFYNVYSVQDISGINFKAMAFIDGSIFFSALLGIIAVKLFRFNDQQGPVVVQASFRSNCAVMGLPLIAALCTENVAATNAFGSIVVGFANVINNLLAIPVLSRCSGRGKPFGKVLKEIFTNPMTIGSLTGLVFLFARKLLPAGSDFRLENKLPALFNVIQSFGKASSPMALFCLGAGLDFKSVKTLKKQISVAVALKLVICPVIIIGAALLLQGPLGITKIEVPGLLAIAAAPVAIVSAVLAQEMGGDTQLANQIVVWSCVFSMVTVFLFIFLLRTIGLL